MSNSETLSFVRLRSTPRRALQRALQRSHTHRQTYRQRGGGAFASITNDALRADILAVFAADPVLSQFQLLIDKNPTVTNTPAGGVFTANPQRVATWMKAVKYQDKLLHKAFDIVDSTVGLPAGYPRDQGVTLAFASLNPKDYDKYLGLMIPVISLTPYKVPTTKTSSPAGRILSKWDYMFTDVNNDSSYKPTEMLLLLTNPARVENRVIRSVARIIHSLLTPLNAGQPAPIHGIMPLLKDMTAEVKTKTALITKYRYYVTGSVMTETNAGLRDSWVLNEPRIQETVDSTIIPSLETFFSDFLSELSIRYSIPGGGGAGTFLDPAGGGYNLHTLKSVNSTKAYGKLAAYYFILRFHQPMNYVTLEAAALAGGDATVEADQRLQAFLGSLQALTENPGVTVQDTAAQTVRQPGGYIDVGLPGGMTFKQLLKRMPIEYLMFLLHLDGAYEEVINE